MAKSLTNSRPIEKVRQSMSIAGNYCEPPLPLSSAEAYTLYAYALGSVPGAYRNSVPVQMLCMEIAETQAQLSRMNEAIAREGEVITSSTGRQVPHPLLAPRHSAGTRLLSLLSRAKMLPQADTRELQRQGQYESALRGHTPLAIPQHTDGETPDWEALLQQETGNAV